MARVEVVPWSMARMCVLMGHAQKGGEAPRSIDFRGPIGGGGNPRPAPPLGGARLREGQPAPLSQARRGTPPKPSRTRAMAASSSSALTSRPGGGHRLHLGADGGELDREVIDIGRHRPARGQRLGGDVENLRRRGRVSLGTSGRKAESAASSICNCRIMLSMGCLLQPRRARTSSSSSVIGVCAAAIASLETARGDGEADGGAFERGLAFADGRLEIGARADVSGDGDLQRFRRRRGDAFGLAERALERHRRGGIADDVGRLLDDGRISVQQRVGALIERARGADGVHDPLSPSCSEAQAGVAASAQASASARKGCRMLFSP